METCSCLGSRGFISTFEVTAAYVGMFAGKHHQLCTCCDYGMSTMLHAPQYIICLVEGRGEVGQLACVLSILPQCQQVI
jgi:hypothetical protein